MADVDLIFTNAMTFNEDTAPVYQDALVLKVNPQSTFNLS